MNNNTTDTTKRWLPDGPGYSIDGGYYWVRGDSIYFNNGQVFPNRFCPMRLGPIEPQPGTVEDFSAWSDEKRAAVLAESEARWAEAEAREQTAYESRKALCIAARAKLTADEWYAVYHAGGKNENPLEDSPE